jgi:hypothetical protein
MLLDLTNEAYPSHASFKIHNKNVVEEYRKRIVWDSVWSKPIPFRDVRSFVIQRTKFSTKLCVCVCVCVCVLHSCFNSIPHTIMTPSIENNKNCGIHVQFCSYLKCCITEYMSGC